LVDWNALQKHIDISFNDTLLLKQAFTHSSYLNENPDSPVPDNERLEFLGDSVLNFVTSKRLYTDFPHLPEGELTELRISLIREETLAQLAWELNLGDYLILGKGEEATGGRQRPTNLANAFEALVGAIFLDQGIDKAGDFILNKLVSQIEKAKTGGILLNYKSLLQEYTQAKYKKVPTYRIKGTSGPDHDKMFVIEAFLGQKQLGKGSGKSKKSAEMDAARAAYEKLNKTDR
jgi:ribonuclease-3